MQRPNEIDIMISENGDLILEGDDLVFAIDLDYIKQQVHNRIKTMSPDWFYDNIGADLEQLLGQPNTRDTASKGIDLIRDILTKGGLVDSESIYIKPVPVSMDAITYFVMIKVSDATEPLTFKVDIALSAGINIKEV